MKRFFMLLFAVVAFAACEQVYVDVANDMSADDRSLSVSFEDDDTRIQLNEAQKTVWTKGDLVSVFYRSTVNEQWQFDGETGDRVGDIVPVDNSVNPPATHNRVVVVYPYNAGYFLNTETYSIEASLPAVQSYLKDSYGTDGNIMVSSSNYKQVSLKSVCGWLKLQLTGNGEVVKSITFKGNNGEQVAGEIYVNTADATCVLASASGAAGDDEVGGTLVRPGTILYDVTLDCGEGVTLGAEPTAFYIALPPQTFEKGVTVEIIDDSGYTMTQTAEKSIAIARNTIQPMAAFEYEKIPNNQIWYTSSDGNIVKPNNTNNDFGATIISNEYNNGKGVITFDGDITLIGEEAFCCCVSLTSVTIPDSVTTIGDNAFSGCDSLTSVTIPDSVTTIVDRAFGGCHNLTSVTIPDSVTAIGEGAFACCCGLTSITIPDGVTTIESETFSGCSSLTSITIPDSVTTIGNDAFYWCTSLTSVNIPDSVTTIGNDAFYYCTSLTSVNIPDGVTTIGDWAFAGCHSLTSVNIPDSVTTIGYGAFADCSSLAEFKGKFAEDNGRILVVDGVLKAFAPAGISEYTIPDSVTTIGNEAFFVCNSLASITIPNSVTTIGVDAFKHCDNLSSITIPDSVTTIGYGAFYGCDSLISVFCKATTPPTSGYMVFDFNSSGRKIYVPTESVDAYKSAEYWSGYASAIVGYDFEKDEIVEMQPNNEIWYTSSDGKVVKPYYTDVFGATIVSNTYNNGIGVITFDGDVTTIGKYAFSNRGSLTSVTIPDSVTTIREHAFAYCTSLTSVNIPDSVTTIGNYAFSECWILTSVNIPDSVMSIGNYAFYSCNRLTSVTIPDSVTEIGEKAFESCSSLTSVNIPDSVTSIGRYAFRCCTSLTSVYCKATTPPALGGSVFDSNGSGRKIYVPAGSVNAYKSAEGWSEYRSYIVGYNF